MISFTLTLSDFYKAAVASVFTVSLNITPHMFIPMSLKGKHAFFLSGKKTKHKKVIALQKIKCSIIGIRFYTQGF